MRDGECPKCGSHEVFVSTWPGGLCDGSVESLHVTTDSGDPRDEGRFYVCVECGFLEHYLDENVLAKIAAIPNGRNWSKVVPPGWYADPAGRHELRFWDGYRWTSMVRDGETESEDAHPL